MEYQGSIVVGGLFEQAGGRIVNNIARWNGSGWEPLGTGVDYWVLSLAVFDGDLIAGGSFQHAGGVATSGIARWDGESWSAMGSGLWFIPNNTNVNALAVDGNTLVAGGYFATSGTTAVKNIARWNGASWQPIGAGVDLHVFALAVRSGVVYAGGRRGRERTIPQYLAEGGGLAMWNGVTWESPGGGLQPGPFGADVHSLSVHGDRLIVGGVFARVGGSLDASNIAGWDGSSWTSLGEGLPSRVHATFSAAGGILYAGGDWLRSWDGTSWNTVPGIAGSISALHSAGNDLLAAGDFQTSGPGNATAFHVARYGGGSWQGFDYWTEQMRGLASRGRNPAVMFLTEYGDHFVAGGAFDHAGDPPSWGERDRIAEWDGVRWTALPPLPAGNLMAATEWNGTLYVSGDFPSGNPTFPYIPVYRLEPNGWAPVGMSIFLPLQNVMAVYQGALHIGARSPGGSRAVIQRLTGNQWGTIGEATNFNGVLQLTSMVEFGGKLVLGGGFKAIDGVPATSVATWDGSRWEQFGTGLPGPYDAHVGGLAVHGGFLVATGLISAPGTPPNSVVRWSGSQWDAMGSLTESFATLGTAYDDLFLIGSAAGRIGVRRWDGQDWTSLGSGTDGPVYDLLGHGGSVYLGGSFSRAGGKSSFGMARWSPTTTSVEPAPPLALAAPNPFRSSTSLTYRVPEAGSVRVSVHDVMGREIAVLVRGSKSPGTYGTVWNGKDERGNLVPAGIYFIRAALPGDVEFTRKVVRLR